MFLAQRPSRPAITRFLLESRELPLSYAPIGLVRTQASRRGMDDALFVIGRGQADFERARAALLALRHFNIGWVEAFPQGTPITVGTVFAVLIRHLGFWSLNGCRVLYTVGSPEDGTHFGVGHGTLTNHAESGEELCEVFLDPQTEDVLYHIRAMSWPRAMLARIGHPIARWLQARFRRHSAEAMRRAVAENSRAR